MATSSDSTAANMLPVPIKLSTLGVPSKSNVLSSRSANSLLGSGEGAPGNQNKLKILTQTKVQPAMRLKQLNMNKIIVKTPRYALNFDYYF